MDKHYYIVWHHKSRGRRGRNRRPDDAEKDFQQAVEAIDREFSTSDEDDDE